MKLLAPALALVAVSLSFAGEPQPQIYRTSEDVARMAAQALKFPWIAAAQQEILKESNEDVLAWRKKHPATAEPASADSLIAAGRASGVPPLPGALINATAYVIHPSPELGAVIREQILYSVGARRTRGSWRDLGIHEGERMMEFLKADDLIHGTGLLSEADQRLVNDEIHRAGYFFEAWTLDDALSSIQRGETYCLNINLYPASILGVIAMSHPDFPESADWLRLSQEQIVKYLLTEFALDGGYGEGSEHYYHPTMKALLEFMTASKNLGVHDYSKDEAVAAAIRRAIRWRTDLMAPDGRSTAIGDAHRDQFGAAEFELAARLFKDPDLAWAGRRMIELAPKSTATAYKDSFVDPLVTDLTLAPQAPTRLFSSYPWSGYVFFRSSWETGANFFMMKYGPTWIGRRQAENQAVMPGHSHEDNLEIELHWSGWPLLVDPGGYSGYADYERYGGYWKATIAHNTVGLGNPWGYDRLDGKYLEHVRDHGADFRYEREQKIIGPADYDVKAVGDTGAAGLVSVAVRTFEDVTHQRTAIWLRDNSVTILFDQLTSREEQPYEWYLHPVGALLSDKDGLTFGDSTAELKIVTIPTTKTQVAVLQSDEASVPPYYAALHKDARGPDQTDGPDARWALTGLVVESVKARSADFFHLLIPSGKDSPWRDEPLGSHGRKLSGKDDTLLLGTGNNSDRTLALDGAFGFVREQGDRLTTYALHAGTSLDLRGAPLIRVSLQSTGWASRYQPEATVLVSLRDKRASIGLPPSPLERRLILTNPKKGLGSVAVTFSFRTGEKPQRIIGLKSQTEMPSLDDPAYVRRTTVLKPDPVSWRYPRRELPFQYDEAQKMVTVTLPPGITQLVWQ